MGLECACRCQATPKVLVCVHRDRKQWILNVNVSVRPISQSYPVANVSDSCFLCLQIQEAMDL